MSIQITISAELSSVFDEVKFGSFLDGLQAIDKQVTDQYKKRQWDLDGVKISLYERKLVLQGKRDDHHKDLFIKVCGFEGIILDAKNKEELGSLSPKRQNAILCTICTRTSLHIVAEVQGLEIKFKKECGHSDNMNTPFNMINNRILPDISILVSKTLSRLLEIGYFGGFEVLIPRIAMKIVDSMDKGTKSGVSDEIISLKYYESENKISVRDYDDKYQGSSDDLNIEDDILIEISDTTNSVLLTSDDNMKSKALLKNRPVIFFDRKSRDNIKMFHDLKVNQSRR